jgi:DNA-binding beta-propeller fold protein YncE
MPHSLAVAGEGWLLVSDQGDHQVKLVDGDGAVLRRWSGPTDGHGGLFNQPAGLAVSPNGDAVVADAGNGRVVRIVAPAAARSVFLPLIGIH